MISRWVTNVIWTVYAFHQIAVVRSTTLDQRDSGTEHLIGVSASNGTGAMEAAIIAVNDIAPWSLRSLQSVDVSSPGNATVRVSLSAPNGSRIDGVTIPTSGLGADDIFFPAFTAALQRLEELFPGHNTVVHFIRALLKLDNDVPFPISRPCRLIDQMSTGCHNVYSEVPANPLVAVLNNGSVVAVTHGAGQTVTYINATFGAYDHTKADSEEIELTSVVGNTTRTINMTMAEWKRTCAALYWVDRWNTTQNLDLNPANATNCGI